MYFRLHFQVTTESGQALKGRNLEVGMEADYYRRNTACWLCSLWFTLMSDLITGDVTDSGLDPPTSINSQACSPQTERSGKLTVRVINQDSWDLVPLAESVVLLQLDGRQ